LSRGRLEWQSPRGKKRYDMESWFLINDTPNMRGT